MDHLVDISRKPLHTEYEDVGKHGVALSDASGGVEVFSFPPLTRMEMELELTQHMMKGEILVGKIMKWRVSLMKDHFSLSKAFTKSIFKIVLGFFPFIFLK